MLARCHMAVVTHQVGSLSGPCCRLTDAATVLDGPQCPLRIGCEKREVLFTHYLVSLLQLLQRDVSVMVQRFAIEWITSSAGYQAFCICHRWD
jgi:hypothetical protein